VAFADRLLLNKIDLVSEADLERIEARLRGMNHLADIQRTQQSAASVESVLDIHGFDVNRVLEMDPEFLNADGEHVHDHSVSSLSIQQVGNVHQSLFQEWIQKVLQENGNDIYRCKGVLSISNVDTKYVYQGVHMILNAAFDDEMWGDDEPRANKLVFIGKNLDREALKIGFSGCLDTPENEEKNKAMTAYPDRDPM
jgi:G3E family GTPase